LRAACDGGPGVVLEFQIIQIVCWLLLGCGFVGKALALSTNPQAGALKEGSLLRSLLGTR
jgi:hypothetical protein